MSGSSANLGVCFFADRILYALNDQQESKRLFHIGSLDFNFNIVEALGDRTSSEFKHIQRTIDWFKSEYDIRSVRALTHPTYECWTTLPKVVYDNADEREHHLSILMKGVPREDIEPTWHHIHNTDYRFLCLRRRSLMNGFDELTSQIALTDFSSDFEIAQKWSSFAKPGGSFLMVGCHRNLISITSFLLGKFRAATFIRFDDLDDLPYHWLQQSAYSSWLRGIHEYIFLFGHQTHEVEQALHGLWDSAGEITILDSLHKMGVTADEETYGFDLAAAFPAILLALDE
ncbi:MAG: hypothetical protein AAFW89_10845 [Bacteroidota bacterium]